jgi:hypothetical protein
MDDREKSQLYERLMYENDKVSNQIASIKGENLEMNENQQERINRLQVRQQQIVDQVSRLY